MLYEHTALSGVKMWSNAWSRNLEGCNQTVKQLSAITPRLSNGENNFNRPFACTCAFYVLVNGYHNESPKICTYYCQYIARYSRMLRVEGWHQMNYEYVYV